FIRRWVPELATVPAEFLAAPERMSAAVQDRAGCLLGRDYPVPVVDHLTAYRAARRRVYAVRRRSEARSEARRVYFKHGSRRRPGQRRRPRSQP
ncbi:MAG: FAD-binding domain-containing protein, partial [Myxococcota bacterium]